MSDDPVLFEGIVGIKTAFLWAEKRLVILEDRVEYYHPDRPHTPVICIKLDLVTLSPIIRHHRHYEFTLFYSESGTMRRVRMRTPDLNRTEYIHSTIQRTKVIMEVPRHPMNKRDRLDISRMSLGRAAQLSNPPSIMRGHSNHQKFSGGLRDTLPHRSDLSPLFNQELPHVTLNLLVVLMVVLTVLIAPMLNSLAMTLTLVLGLALGVSGLLNVYSIDVPMLHLTISFAPIHYPDGQISLDGIGTHHSFHSLAEQDEENTTTRSDDHDERGSRSSSLNELGYSTPVPGTPDKHRKGFAHEEVSVLFSESSKFLSNVASSENYRQCYDTLMSVSETIVRLLKTQPEGIAPSFDVQIVLPSGMKVVERVTVVPDDLEQTKAEWNLIRNKNGLRVLTSKLSSSMKRWPIISAVTTVDASLEDVYRSTADDQKMKKIDEFLGSCQVIAYTELMSVTTDDATPSPYEPRDQGSRDSSDETPPVTLLMPERCPILIKYQQMKSVWPVQPRDYLAIQTGFDVTTSDGRKGKFFISKSVDPHPKDPHGSGLDGYIRGSLTASAFLLVENAEKPNAATDLWSFLHCDMRGNLSGVGKIADFITQSQMPKFVAKLEAVSQGQ